MVFFLVATISSSPCYTHIHREEDFVTYLQDLISTYSFTILTETQKSQLKSCYRVKSNVEYTLKIKNGKEELSLDIKYWK